MESLTDRRALLAVDYALERHVPATDRLEVAVTLRDADGVEVASARQRIGAGDADSLGGTLRLRLNNPHRWNLDDPYLYTLQADLLRNGERIDGCSFRTGLRTLTFDPDRGFALNGRWIEGQRGLACITDAGVLGAAVPPKCGAGVWRTCAESV